ncbi:MAG: glycosyltransferase family 4 protein [Parcubacteria group bacterium]|nr:glycosyltransferase family 4 protein [Parcubacteria group bacterium]
MKILLANKFHYLKGGAERHYFDLGELLEKRGHEVIPFAMADEKNKTSRYNQYFVSNIGIVDPSSTSHKLKTASRIVYSLEAKRKIAALVEKTKPDIAHVHNIYHQLSPSILSALKKKGVPIVMTVHDFKLMCPAYLFYSQGEVCEKCKRYRYYNCVRRRCVKDSYGASLVNMTEMYIHRLLRIYKNNVDKFICPSVFLRDKLVEFGFPKEKLVVVPHFVDCQSIEPQYGGDYILYLGRLSREKGVATLLQAMTQVEGVKLKIAGSGPLEDDLRAQKEKLNLDQVEFMGFLAGGGLQRAIAGASLIAVPSESYETFGLSVIEAYAHGKPVIASRIGALPEVVKEGETGYLFESGKADELADKIKQALADQAGLEKMGEKARRYVAREFTPEKYYDALLEVYRSIKKEAQ